MNESMQEDEFKVLTLTLESPNPNPNPNWKFLRTPAETFSVVWCCIMLPMCTALPVALLFVSNHLGVQWALLVACLLPAIG